MLTLTTAQASALLLFLFSTASDDDDAELDELYAALEAGQRRYDAATIRRALAAETNDDAWPAHVARSLATLARRAA